MSLLPFVRLKILQFTKGVFLIFQVFQNIPLKSIRIFSYIPISEVAPKFSHKFHKIIIKIFQNFVVIVSKPVQHFFRKISLIYLKFPELIFHGTSIDTFRLSIDTYRYQIFSILQHHYFLLQFAGQGCRAIIRKIRVHVGKAIRKHLNIP